MIKKSILVAAILAASTSANAGTITFDPFPSIPADVSVNYFSGGITGPLLSLPAALPDPLVSTSSAVPGGGTALLFDGGKGVLLTFSSFQKTVSAIGNDFGGDPVGDNEVFHLTAFDSMGTVVGSSTTALPWTTPDLKPVSFTSGLVNIKYVAFTYETDLGYYAVDSIAYAVPEPETYAMLIAGLGLLGGIARRRNRD